MAEQDRATEAGQPTQPVRPRRCPICGNGFTLPDGQPIPKWFPFCSPRCKWVDLAGWLDGHYKIITPIVADRSSEQQ